jgi:hypothetical protein
LSHNVWPARDKLNFTAQRQRHIGDRINPAAQVADC